MDFNQRFNVKQFFGKTHLRWKILDKFWKRVDEFNDEEKLSHSWTFCTQEAKQGLSKQIIDFRKICLYMSDNDSRITYN